MREQRLGRLARVRLHALDLQLEIADQRARLARRGTSEAWFPLVNFLDFRDDDLPGWRSIVELASSA
ncbi:hypothetical protein EWM64_g7873 [Hericium alpestre]|uniref:Uncharacterized protein n=1 Tax=Hericium alpestre TaxID=135208 RepID=A0A4Y9ZRM3_9AGAM|nr:hypothetical protein EWM64_g7873 [Hericium alpestre]